MMVPDSPIGSALVRRSWLRKAPAPLVSGFGTAGVDGAASWSMRVAGSWHGLTGTASGEVGSWPPDWP